MSAFGILTAILFFMSDAEKRKIKSFAAICIRENKDNIISEWESRVRSELSSAGEVGHFALTDSMPLFVDTLIQALEMVRVKITDAVEVSEAHAIQRSALTQYSLEHILAEYRIMLQVILDLLSNEKEPISNDDRNIIINLIHSGKAAAAKKFSEFVLEKQQEVARALQEAEEFRKRMLESSEDCFKVLDLNGILINITDRSLAHLEFANADSVLGQPWINIWTRPEDRREAQKAIEAAQKGHVGNLVGYFRTKSGKREWWDVTISPMNDEFGNPEKLLVVSRDVTKQKKALEQLELSEIRFRQMFEQSGIGKVIIEPEKMKIIQSNDSFCRMIGFTQVEMQQMSILEITHPDDREGTRKNYDDFFHGAQTYWHSEKRYIRKDKKVIWASLHATALRDPKGKMVVLGTIIDISDRKNVEADKERLLERLESLQLITETALLETTTLQSLLNKSLEIIKGRIDCDTMAILLLCEAQQTLEVKAAIGLEEEVERKIQVPIGRGIAGKIIASGKRMRFDDLANVEIISPVLNEKNVQCLIGVPLKVKGKMLGVFHIGRLTKNPFTDEDLDLLETVSDRISMAIDNAQLYESLVKNIDNLKFERAMREQFVNTLTHDLRNPLTAAKMSALLIARSPGDERVPDFAWRVINSVDRADRMIRDLLDANRIRAGYPLPIKLENCDVVKLTSKVVDEFISIKGRRFKLKMPSELNAKISCKDYVRVLENLIGNAIKYGAEREIEINLQKFEENKFKVSIHNWGNPIPEEKLEQLFNPFSRTPEAELNGTVGWGLGLTLVRGVVEAHGGQVNVKSNEKEGTTFTVVLPTSIQ